MQTPLFISATQIAALIREGKATATQVITAHLDQIEQHNPELNAIVTVNAEEALSQARETDRALSGGAAPGPLCGVPVTVKDMIETAGLRTTSGHKPFADNIPTRDAVAVARLKAAGAIIIGKTNMPAQGMDIQTDNALFGVTKNPWDLSRTPGGSSGGEGAALAAGMSALGVGTDIGGSVRIPAHYCGLVALKPTEGLIPMEGVVLPGSVRSVRHMAAIGPMARSVADLRLALEVMRGTSESAHGPHEGAPPGKPLHQYRFAYCERFGDLPVSAHTQAALEHLVARLREAGCEVTRASPPEFGFDDVWRTYGELFGVMAAAGLSAPMRYLIRVLGPLIAKDRIARAGARCATASARRYFTIMERRDALISALEQFLTPWDAWITPASVTQAFPHRKRGDINFPIDVDGVRIAGNFAGTGYTCPFNLTGHPALILPVERTVDGLPLGLQLIGALGDDDQLLETAEAVSTLLPAFAPPQNYA